MSEYPNRISEPCPTPTARREELAKISRRPEFTVPRHELTRISRKAAEGGGYIEDSRCEGCGAMSSTHVYPLGELSTFF